MNVTLQKYTSSIVDLCYKIRKNDVYYKYSRSIIFVLQNLKDVYSYVILQKYSHSTIFMLQNLNVGYVMLQKIH